MRISTGKRPAVWGAPCTMTYRPTCPKSLQSPSGTVRLRTGAATGGLDRVAGHGDQLGPLEMLDPVADVDDAGRPPVAVDDHLRDHAVGPDLRPMGEGVGDVGDKGRRLGVDLAALQAESPIDAVVPVPEPAVGDGHRTDPGFDAGRGRPPKEDFAVAADGLGVIRVAVGVAPRPGLPGYREFLLERLRNKAVDRRNRWASRRRPRRANWCGSPRDESEGCSPRSGPSSRRPHGRSCWNRAGRGRRRQ